DAAQYESAHDALAELRFRDQHGAQPLGRDDQGLDPLARMAVDERGPAGERRELAHERAGLVRHERYAAIPLVVARDVDMAGEDDGEGVADRADRRQRFPGAERANLAEPAQALDL